MGEEKLLQNLYLQLRSTTTKFLSQQKYYIETLQAMEILLLKALREEDFGHELQQYLRFLAMSQINLNQRPKKNIVDEKQFGTKKATNIISPLNASRKLLVSEVLKLVKLILLAPTINAAIGRQRSMLCGVKTYL